MIARDVRRRWTFRALERVVSCALTLMARLAHDDDDVHELNHIAAQLAAGETSRCGADCPLRCRDAMMSWAVDS